MSGKTKNSLVARIASRCGFFYIGTLLIWSFTPAVNGPVGNLLKFACAIVVPLLGAVAIILGIVALCRLTPEEKAESIWTSGTTKNLAVVGVAVPPAMALVGFLFCIIAKISI